MPGESREWMARQKDCLDKDIGGEFRGKTGVV